MSDTLASSTASTSLVVNLAAVPDPEPYYHPDPYFNGAQYLWH